MRISVDSLSGLEKSEGHYVNYFKVGYNPDVFVIDNYQYFPEDPESGGEQKIQGNLKLRLITSPSDARQLLKSLVKAIEKYEAVYGTIQDVQIDV